MKNPKKLPAKLPPKNKAKSIRLINFQQFYINIRIFPRDKKELFGSR